MFRLCTVRIVGTILHEASKIFKDEMKNYRNQNFHICEEAVKIFQFYVLFNNNNNNNNYYYYYYYYYLLQLGCHLVAVVILHVKKT